MKPIFNGIIPPVPTIFHGNGKVHIEQMAKFIDYLIDSKVDGLFFLGTGGEFSQLSFEEKMEMIDFVTEYVDKRVPVLIGTGSTNTREVILLNRYSQQKGADGVVVINPYYWNLTPKNLYLHYKTIIEATKLPVLLYNFPDLTGQDLSPDFVTQLAKDFSSIVGIKETIDSIGHIKDMINKVKSIRPDFAVFSGFDDHLLNNLLLGGDGAISASINFAPELSVNIYKHFYNAELEQALNLQKRLSQLTSMYSLDSPFVGVIKEAINARVMKISTQVLAPAYKLEEDKKEKLIQILSSALLV